MTDWLWAYGQTHSQPPQNSMFPMHDKRKQAVRQVVRARMMHLSFHTMFRLAAGCLKWREVARNSPQNLLVEHCVHGTQFGFLASTLLHPRRDTLRSSSAHEFALWMSSSGVVWLVRMGRM